MSPEEKTLARLRIEKARHTLRAAHAVHAAGEEVSVINRCYYACFYAANALLYTDLKWSKKHTGVRSILNDSYIKSDLLSEQAGRTYNELFKLRMKCDYEDDVEISKEQAEQWITKSDAFVDEVAEIVYNRTPPPLADPQDLKE